MCWLGKIETMTELRLVVDLPSGTLDSPEERTAIVAEALAERADELALDLHAVTGEASLSGSGVALLDDTRVETARPTSGRFWQRWWLRRISTRHRQHTPAWFRLAERWRCRR